MNIGPGGGSGRKKEGKIGHKLGFLVFCLHLSCQGYFTTPLNIIDSYLLSLLTPLPRRRESMQQQRCISRHSSWMELARKTLLFQNATDMRTSSGGSCVCMYVCTVHTRLHSKNHIKWNKKQEILPPYLTYYSLDGWWSWKNSNNKQQLLLLCMYCTIIYLST